MAFQIFVIKPIQLFSIAVTAIVVLLIIGVAPASASVWYIDNNAIGANNGTSWINAWKSFSAISWNDITAGDTLYISGGSTAQTYNETFIIAKSGSLANPIKISTGQESGHNGIVIIDSQYTRPCSVVIQSRSYLKLTGQVGQSANMRLANGTKCGLDIDGNSTDLEIAYLDVASNGTSSDTDGITAMLRYTPNPNIEIHHCLIHDNYQDGIHMVQNSAGEATQLGTVRLHHNNIYNINDDGIEISFGADIYNNEIGTRLNSGGRGHPDGIQFYNSHTRIYSNYIHDFVRSDDPGNANSAIFCDPFDPDITLNPHDIQIYNNLLVETAVPSSGDVYRGIAAKFAEPGVTSANNILIANNTIIGMPFFGMTFTMGSLGTTAVSNVVIENNIFKDCARVGFGSAVIGYETGNGTITYGSHGGGNDVTVDYNNFFASSGIYRTTISYGPSILSLDNFKSASGCESHGIAIDPQLSSIFKLNQKSPCIKMGVGQTQFSIDKEGIMRPNGGSWDVGAYEFQAVQAPSNLKILTQ